VADIMVAKKIKIYMLSILQFYNNSNSLHIVVTKYEHDLLKDI